MATYSWIGGAEARAQVSTITVTAYDAATTYTISVGGVVVASAIAAGSANLTATALATDFNASTHPYATGITALASTNTVSLTGDTAGVPFGATAAVSAGTGTISNTLTTTSTSGYHLNNPANWLNVLTGVASTTFPTNSDTLIIAGGPNIVWDNEDENTEYVGLYLMTNIYIMDTYTGRIGTDTRYFVTSADGTSVNQNISDYQTGQRQSIPRIRSTTLYLGRLSGTRNATGSQRINIQHRCGDIYVESTAASSIDTGLTPVRIISMISSGTDRAYAPDLLSVSSAPGGVTYGRDVVATDAANTPAPTTVMLNGANSVLKLNGLTKYSNNFSAITQQAGIVQVLNSSDTNPTTGWTLTQYGGQAVFDGAGEIAAITQTAGTCTILRPQTTTSFTLTQRGQCETHIPRTTEIGATSPTISTLTQTHPQAVLRVNQNAVTITTNSSTAGQILYQ